MANNSNEFTDAIRLFYKKEYVAKYNYEAITKLGSPVASIDAIHSCAAAASTESNDAGGLEPIIFMAKGAQVTLTSNL